MTEEEKILLEEYFPMKNMNEDDRAFYLKMLFAIKELTDSDFNLGNSPSQYDFTLMTLNNSGPYVSLDGCITNGVENKLMYGSIIRKNNTYFIVSNYSRLSSEVTDVKNYTVTDNFIFNPGGVIRESCCQARPEDPVKVTFMTNEELIEYFREKIGVTRGRKPHGDVSE